jgi:UDP-N-acetylglucosamine 2-epimerase
VIYPNSDAGGRIMVRFLEKNRNVPYFRFFKSLSRLEFLSLLKYASALVGNSSSGMIESSSFHIPVVNIGVRQKDRERGANVFDVPHNASLITKAIRHALSKPVRRRLKSCKNPYGEGRASRRIAKVLASIPITSHLLEKQIAY